MLDPTKWKKAIVNNRITILLAVSVLYVFWKGYVIYTPDPSDDDLPDRFKDAVVTIVYADASDADQDNADDADIGVYGERA